MNIFKYAEFELSTEIRAALQELLVLSFPEVFPHDRIYLKQLPHLRLLAKTKSGQLIGQVGLDYRVMNLNRKPVRVLGIIDLCVHPHYRSHGIASRLLTEVMALSHGKPIDFLLLFADNPSLYKKAGFRSVVNHCTWLQINDETQTTHGIGEEIMPELMIKELSSMQWEDGPLDLLGYLY